MMDYGFTEEQLAIQSLTRAIAEREVRPVAAEYDRSGEFPWPVVRTLAQADLFRTFIPEEYGGIAGGTPVTNLVLVTEELSKACGGIALALAGTALGAMPILLSGTRLHLGTLITLAVVFLGWGLLGKSLVGFQLKVVGQAPRAARYAGFSDKGLIWLSMMLGGGLAGAAGLFEVAGPVGQLTPQISPGYGFTAIIVAFLGRLNPLGVLVAGIFLALTVIGGEGAQIALKVPLDLTKVFQGILLFYVLACDSLIVHRIRLLAAPGRPAHGHA